MASTESISRGTPAGPACPICGRPAVADLRPFCSRRCADVDLARWIRGGYAIPGRVEDDEDGEKPPPATMPPDTDTETG